MIYYFIPRNFLMIRTAVSNPYVYILAVNIILSITSIFYGKCLS